MKRDWDLIRGLLHAIDIDYDLGKRHHLFAEMVVLNGINAINYHLCLLFESKLVRYYRPKYSELSKQIESEPVQLTKAGVELLKLMRDNDAWKKAKLLLTHGGHVSASQDVLVSALDRYFISGYCNAA
jgi:hypothetical protein